MCNFGNNIFYFKPIWLSTHIYTYIIMVLGIKNIENPFPRLNIICHSILDCSSANEALCTHHVCHTGPPQTTINSLFLPILKHTHISTLSFLHGSLSMKPHLGNTFLCQRTLWHVVCLLSWTEVAVLQRHVWD